MSEPVIISSYDPGIHNANLESTVSRLDKDLSWKDLSTIMVVPAGGTIPTKVVASWLNLITPPNNKFVRLFAIGVEVGEAYENCFSSIISHPDLSKWKYVLTVEHDNIPPSDGLIKLQQRMEMHPEYSGISGLYFTKGPSGCAQIWGDPREMPLNFRPQKPDPNGGLVECSGLGQGFCLFRISMFHDKRLRRPWFKTTASKEEGVGTQDLRLWANAREHGYRCAVDCGVRVGHFDLGSDICW